MLILETFCSQRLGTAGPLRCGEMFALDTLSRELGLFKMIRNLTEDNPNSQRHPSEGKNFYWASMSQATSSPCCWSFTFTSVLQYMFRKKKKKIWQASCHHQSTGTICFQLFSTLNLKLTWVCLCQWFQSWPSARVLRHSGSSVWDQAVSTASLLRASWPHCLHSTQPWWLRGPTSPLRQVQRLH